MITRIRQKITRNLLNIPGWRTDRRIVVIESDDWGTIRMASKEAYNYFMSIGYPVDKCPYNRFDALESNDDLELLFEVLTSVKDVNGNPAVITANSLVANPDFSKIKADRFENYYFEPITTTLQKYPNHDKVYKLVKDGIEHKVFKPQFHGREHLNVHRWMEALLRRERSVIEAFNWNMFSVHAGNDPGNRLEFMDALYCENRDQLNQLSGVLDDGVKIFRQLWGYDSKSFIANCYIWNKELEPFLKSNGVEYIQGVVYQNAPLLREGMGNSRIFHYQGQRNSVGQRYFVRNAFFEPSVARPAFDSLSDCLKRVSTAFFWEKPAIISSHRLNYIGFIDPENRDRNLKTLKKLLSGIKQRWPQVEFMTSDQLGDLMNGMKDQHCNA